MQLIAFAQNLMDWFRSAFAPAPDSAALISSAAVLLLRFAAAALAILILIRCARALLGPKVQTGVWAWLGLPNGARVPVRHWENTVGRAAASDVILNYPSVSRNHAVLLRREDGGWTVADLGSKGGTQVEGERVSGSAPVLPGDTLTFSGVNVLLLSPESVPETGEPIEPPEKMPALKTRNSIRPGMTLLLLSLFQLIAALELCLSSKTADKPAACLTLGALSLLMWLDYALTSRHERGGFEVETLAFFLSTLGLAVLASTAPGELFKQLLALVLGLVLYHLLSWYLGDLERTKKARWPMGGAALALLGLTFLLGSRVYGAQNWILLGSVSIQPSEFVKIAFVWAGSATLDRLLARRNLILFIAFSGACIGILALLGDFGTALVFFTAFVVIAFLRSGDLAAIGLICAGSGFAGLLAAHFKPYIARRFAAWRHVWQYASTTGYQQTRTLMYAASGGLLGLGAGNGYLKKITAAGTDLVFGVLCEEWGLLVAGCAVLSLLCLAVFTVRSAPAGRSAFYVIAACAAMAMLLAQTALNVFGSVDFLPLTGVTFPFVSNGGSSMAAAWALLSFVRAADTRPAARSERKEGKKR